ncbi:hypothetical protein [Haloarcula litorea]|uniref:hypothetical protein n=1 Tax=Haloarcula litorea TaxID=3032579 RepID=UPI0023E7D07C|nr:hypothetical protein [Halomicroarcula sp. GDY20]
MSRSDELTPADHGLRDRLASRASLADAALLLSVPAALLALWSLPAGVRASLAFDYAAPTPTTAVLSQFVHLGPTHLAVNLAVYALVVPVAYLLSVLSGHRRRFRVVFVSLLVVCPLVLPYLNLAIARGGTSVGFSGVLLALYGYLPLALATHAEAAFGIGRHRQTAPLLFFVGLALVTVLTLAAVVANPVRVPVRGVVVPVTGVLVAALAELVVALALVVALYAFSTDHGWRGVAADVRAAADRTGEFEVAAVGLVLFLTVPFATFPTDPVVDGGVLNLYVHLVGYALGFIGSYATVVVESRLFGPVGG